MAIKKKESKAKKAVKDIVKKVAKAVKPKAAKAVAPKAAPAPEVAEIQAESVKPSFSFEPDNPVALIPLIAHAWDKVKGPGDASFAQAVPDFRQTLLAHALSALKSEQASGGDSPLANFEREILRLKADR